jgi:hypothetical protein
MIEPINLINGDTEFETLLRVHSLKYTQPQVAIEVTHLLKDTKGTPTI